MNQRRTKASQLGPNLGKLISIGGSELCKDLAAPLPELNDGSETGNQLRGMLQQKNGFYAFEKALHVFPSGCRASQIDLATWNDLEGWRKGFGEKVIGILFFAEDIFGVQFGLTNGGVCKFDPETAEVEHLAAELEDWAGRILGEYEYLTGFPLAHEWQSRNGPLTNGKRLLPKVPFVLGGAFDVDNLYAADAMQGMMFRADVWQQIKDLPDGTEVRLKVVD